MQLPDITITDIQAEIERRERERKRHLARTDLFYLLTEVFGRKDIDRPWLKERCYEVQADPDGHLDLWARNHYKSSIITYGKTIQDIIRSHGEGALEPKEYCIGIFSHTRPSAKAFLKQIKAELENNQKLKDLFPDVFYQEPRREAPKWSDDEGIIVRRKNNPKEATVEAWGVVDGQPTGKHFDILVYDDIVTRESVNTPEMIEKTTESLVLSYNLGSSPCKMRFIGTRYHFNDTYRELIARGTVKPRIYTATDDGTFQGKPVLLSQSELDQKIRDMGIYVFSSQMLQNPVADSTQGFKREWLRYYDNVNLARMHTYIIFDPASEKKKTSDYTAAWVIGLGEDNNLYILDMLRDRLNLKERTARLFQWHRKYKPMRESGVRYEKYGMQADIEHIKSVQEYETYRFEITEVAGQTPKNDRIKRLMPYFEQGRVWFPRTMYQTDYNGKTEDLVKIFIEEEYMAFPVPIHDDMLDSLARIAEPDLPLLWPKHKEVEKSSNLEYSYGFDETSWMG